MINTLPEFIKGNYPTFTAFMEAYYEFLEQNVPDSIDSTGALDMLGESFISSFSSDLDSIAKSSMGLSSVDFIDNIQKMFNMKGSPAAYKLAFGLLYGDYTASVEYPSQNVFETSGAQWEVQRYVFVNIGSFNLYELFKNGAPLTRDVDYTVNNGLITMAVAPALNDTLTWTGTYAYNTTDITTSISSYDFAVGDGVTTNFELSFPIDATPYTMIGNTITFSSGMTDYVCLVSAVVRISGNVYQLFIEDVLNNIPSNSTFLCNGIYGQTFASIQGFVPSSIGLGFKAGQTISTSSVNNKDSTIIYVNTINASGGITGYTQINSQYGVTIPSSLSFSSSTSTQPFVINTSASANSQYRGSWITNTGFTSDASYIQDGYYYHQFSYVVKSQQLLSSFYDFVKQYIHPAGTKLFATTVNQNIYSVVSTLEVILKVLSLNLSDTVSFTESVSALVSKNLSDSVSAVDSPSILIDKYFGGSGQTYTVNQAIAVVDNGLYREILNDGIVTNYVTNPTLTGTTSTTPPTGYTVSSSGATINSATYSFVKSNILSIQFNVTGSIGDEIYIDVPLQAIPSTALPYVMSGILSSTNSEFSYGFELTINGSTIRSTELAVNSAYHKSTVINTPVTSITSASVRIYLSLTSNINGYAGITFGNLQLQSGIVPTYFVDNNTPFSAMYSVSGNNVVLTNPLPAPDAILFGFSGQNNVTKENIDTFTGSTYATINDQRFIMLGISDGITTTYAIPSPDSTGMTNLILILVNPYASQDYFTVYADGISQYVGTPTITTE